MARKPNDEMLPVVTGFQIDIDDRDNPTACLVGLVTVEGLKSFTLNVDGANMMIDALRSFVDRVEGGPERTQ